MMHETALSIEVALVSGHRSQTPRALKQSTLLTLARMNASWTLRRVNLSDSTEKSQVVNLVNRCYRGNENWTNESNLVRGQRLNICKLESEMKGMTMFVAVLKSSSNADEKIVGCIKTGLVQKCVVGKLPWEAGYVGTLAVDPEFESNGLGTALLKQAENYCQSLGVPVIVMDVLDTRVDIIAWYQRKGYELTSRKVSASEILLRAGEELLVHCNFVLMEKKLKTF